MREFLLRYRDAITSRWMDGRRAHLATDLSLTDDEIIRSFQLFIDEVLAYFAGGDEARRISRKKAIARIYGERRYVLRAPVEAVAQDYWLFYDAVLSVAAEAGTTINSECWFTLSSCLRLGSAESMREYAQHRDRELKAEQCERFAILAHELRNPLTSAIAGWELVRNRGDPDGRLGVALDDSLTILSSRITDALVELRLVCTGAGSCPKPEHISLAQLIDEVRADSYVDARAKGIEVRTSVVPDVGIAGERRMLRSALTNVVRNAIKFTPAERIVTVQTRTAERRVVISVEDECGGLAPGQAERLFQAFEQAGKDRSGFGLGLAIARQAIEANGGTIAVQNRPGRGCTFLIDLPMD